MFNVWILCTVEDGWLSVGQHECGGGAVPADVSTDHGHHYPPSLHQSE